MRIVTWILHFYPCKWRERYYEEMLEVLEQHTISMFTIFDLLLGALDARLDPSYRSEEGFMLSRIRDARTLSILFIGALAMFMFSATFWLNLNGGLAFNDNPLGATTETIAAVLTLGIVPGLCVVALFIITIVTIKNSFKNRQFGTLCFALLCVAVGVASLIQRLPVDSGPGYSMMDLAVDWLNISISALGVGVVLFVTGVKGLQAIRERQWWPLGLALVIALLLPACIAIYGFWGSAATPGGITQLSPGNILVGNTVFLSLASFVEFLLFMMVPYLIFGALLLALTSQEANSYSWRVVRGFGAVFVGILVANVIAVVVWDGNRWTHGGVWIFDPNHGVWPLFGGQWFGPLLINAFVLVVALGLGILALVRSFAVRPLNKPPVEKMAA
ncbi:MAG TPA: hypothetical protein VFN23_05205 [Ktedonobacteraceae bacterium]|nr:hypothetical protein [Ktedonobacteraceae bacterium]